MALGQGLGGRDSGAESHDTGAHNLSPHLTDGVPGLGRPRNREKKPQELDSLYQWVNGFLLLSLPLRTISSGLFLRF